MPKANNMPGGTPPPPILLTSDYKNDKPSTSCESSTYKAHVAHLQKSFLSVKYTASSVQLILGRLRRSEGNGSQKRNHQSMIMLTNFLA